jgi:hypothetical protein
MVRIFFAAVLVSALVGCQAGPEARLKEAARQTDFIGNPDSVQFRNVADGAPGVLCGEMKYELANGSWSEWTPFIHQLKALEVRRPYSGEVVDELNEKLCGKR